MPAGRCVVCHNSAEQIVLDQGEGVYLLKSLWFNEAHKNWLAFVCHCDAVYIGRPLM